MRQKTVDALLWLVDRLLDIVDRIVSSKGYMREVYRKPIACAEDIDEIVAEVEAFIEEVDNEVQG